VQQSSMCSHVSGWIILHNEQFMLGKSSFQNKCFLAFPMYWPYLNFRSCIICESVTIGLVQKLLEILLYMRGLLIHLFMLSNVLASFSFSSFSSFSRYDFRCLIGPLYGWSSFLHHQYGVEWALSWGWKGISLISTIMLPSFASLSMILVWALTLCRWVVAVGF
jgi:hypothetical protein